MRPSPTAHQKQAWANKRHDVNLFTERKSEGGRAVRDAPEETSGDGIAEDVVTTAIRRGGGGHKHTPFQ